MLNLLLAVYQYNFNAWSWYIAIAWLLIGLFIYFVHFEKMAAPEMPQVLEVGQQDRTEEYDYRILIPMHNPDHVIPLMKLAAPIARHITGKSLFWGLSMYRRIYPFTKGCASCIIKPRF